MTEPRSKMCKMIVSAVAAALLLCASAVYAESAWSPLNTELRINVTATDQDDQQGARNLQIQLNVSVGGGQVLVNGVPVELSGVTRLSCQALLLDGSNSSGPLEAGELLWAVTRVMLSQNRLYSDTEEVVALQVLSQVIELEGRQVLQPDMCEVKILMSPDFQKLAQFTNIYPIGHSELFRAPRDQDVVVGDPWDPRREERQTTSLPPPRQAGTTQEEVAPPGKLPETPLRMDPDLLYDGHYDDSREAEQMQTEAPPTEPGSSYSALCGWVEEVRERVRRFCYESLPLFFLVMWVVVIGVVGSAVIIKVLDVFFPSRQHKLVFGPVKLLPEEEKHTLLLSVREEEEEEEEQQQEEEKKP